MAMPVCFCCPQVPRHRGAMANSPRRRWRCAERLGGWSCDGRLTRGTGDVDGGEGRRKDCTSVSLFLAFLFTIIPTNDLNPVLFFSLDRGGSLPIRHERELRNVSSLDLRHCGLSCPCMPGMGAVVLGENVSFLAVGRSLARRDCDAPLFRERELCALIMEPVMTTGAVKVSFFLTAEGTVPSHPLQHRLILACFTVLLFFCLDWADKAHPDTAFLACGQVRIGIASR